MILKKMQINDNFRITFNDMQYKSTVEDIQEEYYLINIPIAEGLEYLMLQQGQKIEIDFVKDGGYYIFTAEVLGKHIENGKRFYKITVPQEAENIERRDFVRVNLVDYIFYKFKDKWNKAMVMDISGGGMRLKIKEKVNVEDEIVVGLAFGNESYQLKGSIVRVTINENKENICGIEFIDMSEKIRDKIIAKIFEKLRRQLEFK